VRSRKPDDLALGPVAVITLRRPLDERAVPARARDDDGDVRIARDHGIAERRRRHEGIVLGGDDERRHANSMTRSALAR